MDLKNVNICKALVPKNYLENALNAQSKSSQAIKELLEKRKLNECGWPQERITMFIKQLAQLDSNNFQHNIGVGEREARILCPLVGQRHYNFGHGIGRSGDLLEAQPKAAGSTIMQNLTNALLLDLIKSIGLAKCESCILMPMATGMTLTLCMLTLKKQRPNAKYVLWSRIDQKSCFKSITTAGLLPIIIDPVRDKETGALSTNLYGFQEKLNELDNESILCLYTTTSCFAPREPDDICSIAKMAKEFHLPHLVNHAYGLQTLCLNEILDKAGRQGRIDYIVQSTDKNLMVPVGGAIVLGYKENAVHELSKTYAGRASSSQTLDVLMTLLYIGRSGYINLMQKRNEQFQQLLDELTKNVFKEINGLTLINCKKNCISLAIDLSGPQQMFLRGCCTAFGSMLFTRGISGARVVARGDNKSIDGYSFQNWGSHCTSFDGAYVTVAAGLGITTEDVVNFRRVFIKTYNEMANIKQIKLAKNICSKESQSKEHNAAT